jgi:uncharacterized membrane protein YkoI
MRRAATTAVVGVAALAGVTSALAATGHRHHARGGEAGAVTSRLDDGKDLLPQAGIREAQAIRAAQGAASGALDEVDLEHRDGKLVYNVDVGDKDVKVDAHTAQVVAVDEDD